MRVSKLAIVRSLKRTSVPRLLIGTFDILGIYASTTVHVGICACGLVGAMVVLLAFPLGVGVVRRISRPLVPKLCIYFALAV